jgi:hypothetical protein
MKRFAFVLALGLAVSIGAAPPAAAASAEGQIYDPVWSSETLQDGSCQVKVTVGFGPGPGNYWYSRLYYVLTTGEEVRLAGGGQNKLPRGWSTLLAKNLSADLVPLLESIYVYQWTVRGGSTNQGPGDIFLFGRTDFMDVSLCRPA